MRKSKIPGTRFVVTEDDIFQAYETLTESPKDVAIDSDALMELTYSSRDIRRQLKSEGASYDTLVYLDLFLVSILLTGVEIGLDEFTLKSKLVIDLEKDRS